jgi:asparagine synthase (glutamine-hydrolysing)
LCGILISNIYTKEDFLVRFERLFHRGPDSQSFVKENEWYIGHVRLAIIDTHHRSNQPFYFDNLLLIFNGELYNYREIRMGLEEIGYVFETDSDTEVLIKAYHKWGKECLKKFTGMFSFAIYNFDKNSWFAARDRLGQKPFYYYNNDGGFAISSEASVFEGLSFDSEALNIYYNIGYIPAPFSIYKNVKKLEPGHCLEFSNGKLSIDEYWALGDSRSNGDITELDSLIRQAVKKRLQSDVPLAVFLSGGMDSTVISKIASSFTKISSFTARFSRQEYDESDVAIAHNLQIKSAQTIVEIGDDDFTRVFNDFIGRLDEPFGDSSIIGTMVLCQKVPEDVKVILTGDGGDESFFGYNHFKWLKKKLFLDRFIPTIFLSIMSRLFHYLYRKTKQRKWLNIALLTSANRDDFIRYVFTGFTDLTVTRDDNWFDEILSKVPSGSNAFQRLADVNIKLWLEGDSCFKTDRGGMFYGKELRSPFLDHELIDAARRVDVNARFSKKYLRSFANRIGIDISLFDKKRGFTMPITNWLKPLVSDRNSILWQFNYSSLPNFNTNLFFTFLEEFSKGNYSFKEEIWNIYVLIKWIEERQLSD